MSCCRVGKAGRSSQSEGGSVPTIWLCQRRMVGTAQVRLCPHYESCDWGSRYAFSTPHHSATNSAIALVAFFSDSRSTNSLKPCISPPLAPKHRLGMPWLRP